MRARFPREPLAHSELALLAAIIALAAAVRFLGLGHQSFDSGETVTAARVLHPGYAATFDAYSTIERSGPLYYTLAWGWAKLFGTGEIALRSLSAILGTGTVAIAFLIGRELFSRRAALLAAGLCALCPDLIWYSQEARSYPLFIFLGAAGLYFFIRALRAPTRRTLAAWAVCSGLGLATHYFSAFAVIPEALWLIWANRRTPKAALGAVGAVGIVGLALLPLAIHQEGAGRTNAFTAIPVLDRAATSLIKFMTGEGPATSGSWGTQPMLFRVVGLGALALALLAIVRLVHRGTASDRSGAAILGAVGALAFFVPIALALAGLDYVEPRNLLGSLVPLLVVIGAGVDVAIGRERNALFRPVAVMAPLALFAVAFAATWSTPSYQRLDWRAVGRLVAAARGDGVVLAEPPAAAKTLRYFLGHPLPALSSGRFPCGIRARRIVTVGRRQPGSRYADGFRLVSSHRTGQGWVVAIFAARSPQPLQLADLRGGNLLGPHAAPRVDLARAVSPHPVTRTSLLVRDEHSSSRHGAGRRGSRRGQEAVRLTRQSPTEQGRRQRPPQACPLERPKAERVVAEARPPRRPAKA